jgi:hypothetical protein
MGNTACKTGQTKCGGTCYNLQTDNNKCGTDCSTIKSCTAGEKCINGSCQLECAAPTKLCNKECVNYTTDNDHCGACGDAQTPTACPTGTACLKSRCTPVCASPQTACTDKNNVTTCVDDLSTNNAHCGGCDNDPCSAGQTCIGDKCRVTCGDATCNPDQKCAAVCVDECTAPMGVVDGTRTQVVDGKCQFSCGTQGGATANPGIQWCNKDRFPAASMCNVTGNGQDGRCQSNSMHMSCTNSDDCFNYDTGGANGDPSGGNGDSGMECDIMENICM